MPSFEEKIGEPQPTEKEYTQIILSQLPIDRTFVDGTGLPAKIVYFCPECKKIVIPKRVGNKFRFSCSECKQDVAFGTEQSVANYYRLTGKPKTKTNEV